jgi:hypothetical protein
MNQRKIILRFKTFTLQAELFDTAIASKFIENLPYEIALQDWGNEAYGSIGLDLGQENPVAEIPPGGLAYTNNGNYFCIFYGQRPAWPVEYIGQINAEDWKQLLGCGDLESVTVRLSD